MSCFDLKLITDYVVLTGFEVAFFLSRIQKNTRNKFSSFKLLVLLSLFKVVCLAYEGVDVSVVHDGLLVDSA